MDPDDFSIPGVMESPLSPDERKKRKAAAAPAVVEAPSRRKVKKVEEKGAIVYGKMRNDETVTSAAKTVAALGPAVQELMDLERSVQHSFTNLMWSQVGGPAKPGKSSKPSKPQETRKVAPQAAPKASPPSYSGPACSTCGKALPAAEARFCPQCGAKQEDAPAEPEPAPKALQREVSEATSTTSDKTPTLWASGGAKAKAKKKARW
mmetsp:Transcript_34004/g.77988  ORF Transcript_34004/g.77988 Transcript_34004/m.77988 type:complete len:207 (+) Transcript_34004:2-622(+)